jgi:hypothetical protein
VCPQVFREYQARLREAMRPLSRHMPQLPSLAAIPRTLLPTLPTVSDLSQLPAFRDLDMMTTFDDFAPISVRSPSTPVRMPTLPSLSHMPGFRDLESMDTFDDLAGGVNFVEDELRGGLRSWAALSDAAARVHLPDLTQLSNSAAGGIRASVAAAQATLQGSMPFFNLPDWHVPLTNGGGDPGGGVAGGASGRGNPVPSWQVRLCAASSAVLEQADLNGLFVRGSSLWCFLLVHVLCSTLFPTPCC